MTGSRAVQSPPPPVSPTRTARRPRIVLVYGGVLILFAVAMLSASLAGFPRLRPGRSEADPLPEPDPLETFTSAPLPPPQPDTDPSILLLVLATIVSLLVLTVLIVGVIWLIRLLIRYWQDRRLRLRPGAVTDVEVGADLVAETAVDAPTMHRGISAARATILTHAEAGDAIVAAWVGLEETAADSGIGRGKSETPAEFTLRILLRRPGIDDAARELLRLYESVRFGGRIADEKMRTDAVRALDVIEEGWR